MYSGEHKARQTESEEAYEMAFLPMSHQMKVSN
jgi:hypothetical protein